MTGGVLGTELTKTGKWTCLNHLIWRSQDAEVLAAISTPAWWAEKNKGLPSSWHTETKLLSWWREAYVPPRLSVSMYNQTLCLHHNFNFCLRALSPELHHFRISGLPRPFPCTTQSAELRPSQSEPEGEAPGNALGVSDFGAWRGFLSLQSMPDLIVHRASTFLHWFTSTPFPALWAKRNKRKIHFLFERSPNDRLPSKPFQAQTSSRMLT